MSVQSWELGPHELSLEGSRASQEIPPWSQGDTGDEIFCLGCDGVELLWLWGAPVPGRPLLKGAQEVLGKVPGSEAIPLNFCFLGEKWAVTPLVF